MGSSRSICFFWNKVRRLLSDDRTLRPLTRRSEPLPSAVSETVLRGALTRLWYVNDQMRQAQGDACMHEQNPQSSRQEQPTKMNRLSSHSCAVEVNLSASKLPGAARIQAS